MLFLDEKQLWKKISGVESLMKKQECFVWLFEKVRIAAFSRRIGEEKNKPPSPVLYRSSEQASPKFCFDYVRVLLNSERVIW